MPEKQKWRILKARDPDEWISWYRVQRLDGHWSIDDGWRTEWFCVTLIGARLYLWRKTRKRKPRKVINQVVYEKEV